MAIRTPALACRVEVNKDRMATKKQMNLIGIEICIISSLLLNDAVQPQRLAVGCKSMIRRRCDYKPYTDPETLLMFPASRVMGGSVTSRYGSIL